MVLAQKQTQIKKTEYRTQKQGHATVDTFFFLLRTRNKTLEKRMSWANGAGNSGYPHVE